MLSPNTPPVLDIYTRILRIRRFEEQVGKLLDRKSVV